MALRDAIRDLWRRKFPGDVPVPAQPTPMATQGKVPDRLGPTAAVPNEGAFPPSQIPAPATAIQIPPVASVLPGATPTDLDAFKGAMTQWRDETEAQRKFVYRRPDVPAPISFADLPIPADAPVVQDPLLPSDGAKSVAARGAPHDQAPSVPSKPSLSFDALRFDGSPKVRTDVDPSRTPAPGSPLAEALPGATLPDFGTKPPDPALSIPDVPAGNMNVAGVLKDLINPTKPGGLVQLPGRDVRPLRAANPSSLFAGTAGPLLIGRQSPLRRGQIEVS